MRASFVFEKFSDKTDPIRDMNIGMKFPQVLLETAMELFGDMVMFRKMTRTEVSRSKGIWPMYDLNSTMPLTREEWSQLRQAVGKPIPRIYMVMMRIPYEGRNTWNLRIPGLLDEVYGGDFYFIENGSVVEVVNNDQILTRLTTDLNTYSQMYAKIKKFYES